MLIVEQDYGVFFEANKHPFGEYVAEITAQGKVIVCDYQCDGCGEGRLELRKVSETMGMTTYWHICNKCGQSDLSRNRAYPFVFYQRDDGSTFAL